MIHEDMQDITDIERAAVRRDDNLQEIKNHGSLDFPVKIYDVVLSQMYLKLIRWHWHVEIEMIHVLEGKVEALIDNESIILTEGQGLFINQSVLHAFHRVNGHDCVFVSTVFHPGIIFGYGNTTLSLNYFTPISGSPTKYILLDEADSLTAPLIEYLKQIHTHYKSAEFGYELACRGLFCNLWLALLKIPRKDSTSTHKSKRVINDEQRIKDAILYIIQNYAEPITLDDIANSIHISKSECCRCFKRVLHMTPFEYLQKMRIFQAARLIRQQDSSAGSISNLAITVGFGNISYFNKVFKQYMHMTPTEYRHDPNASLPPDDLIHID